jgi:hypothetical protein
MPRLSLAATLFILGALTLFAPAINAEATDATKSESSGNGLQFASAGVLAQFTVTAKDESGVRRTSGGDEWIVELDGTRSLTGSVVDNLDGTYQVSYTATKSGSYEAGVKLAKSGGLTGSYFENVWFFYTPVKVTVDPQINMDWGVGRITPTGANYISVRWVGKVKTQYAETYTFYATTDDGARLWVDNVPLIDRWDSFCNETSATISLNANVFYNMKMEYKQVCPPTASLLCSYPPWSQPPAFACGPTPPRPTLLFSQWGSSAARGSLPAHSHPDLNLNARPLLDACPPLRGPQRAARPTSPSLGSTDYLILTCRVCGAHPSSFPRQRSNLASPYRLHQLAGYLAT